MNNQEKQNQKENNRDLENKSVGLVKQESYFSGPLPPPALLQGYENILPGLADRITKMAESQSEHRKKLESRVITLDSVKSILGLIFAFLIVLAGLGAGVYVYVITKSFVASLFSFIPLGAIVGAFIYQEREKTDKKSK